MQTVFLFCLGIGGIGLVAQTILGLVGGDADIPDVDVPDADLGGSHASAGFDLFSVRSLSAALAVFGATGVWLHTFLPGWLAAAGAIVPAFAASVLTAWLMRLMLRAESSGSLQLAGAVGATGTVYVPVPAADAGTGVVQFTLQGRTVEMRARTSGQAALPSGAGILVISVDTESETVEVVSTTNIEGLE